MKINPVNNSPDFKGLYNNKLVLGALEKISEHSATFSVATSFVMAAGLRPLAISLAPKTDKDNKKYAQANSISSAFMKLLTAEAVILPIESAIKKIDKNPIDYLKSDTIKTLQNNAQNLAESRHYKFLTQTLKQGAGFLSSIPKSILTIAFIPFIMDNFLNKKEEKPPVIKKEYDSVFEPFFKSSKINFKGNFTKGIGKIIDNKMLQNYAVKNSQNDTNIARNWTILTDVLLTTLSGVNIKKSKKIKEEKKDPLIYNGIISTTASILGGTALDSTIKKSTKKLEENFTKANINNPKLSKYIEGINIVRPALAFALVYYGILPIFSTFLSDKIDKKAKNNEKQ